jgi:hypothetical protein
MNIKRGALVVIALIIFSVWIWGFLNFAHFSHANHGPSAQQLTDISNRIVELGHITATKPHFVSRGTWYYVERDIIHPAMSRDEMGALAELLKTDGWLPGRTTSTEKMILCNGQIVLEIVAPETQSSGFDGSITVSWGWGDASTQCREKSSSDPGAPEKRKLVPTKGTSTMGTGAEVSSRTSSPNQQLGMHLTGM